MRAVCLTALLKLVQGQFCCSGAFDCNGNPVFSHVLLDPLFLWGVPRRVKVCGLGKGCYVEGCLKALTSQAVGHLLQLQFTLNGAWTQQDASAFPVAHRLWFFSLC